MSSPGSRLDAMKAIALNDLSIHFHEIPMRRRAAPILDIRALAAWIRLLRRIQPSITVVGTPKAGLLGTISARLAGVPNRVYVLHGLRLEGSSGLTKVILGLAERVVCAAATRVVCVSASLMHRVIELGLVPADKCSVVGPGSPNGVDLEVFRPPTAVECSQARLRVGLLDSNSLVIGYAGRLTRDKGIDVLLDALTQVQTRFPDVVLLIAGGIDATEKRRGMTLETLRRRNANVICLDHWEAMPSFYQALDVFCLPSVREGMPTVNLEAAACGVPVVTTTATGCIDSVVGGRTGQLVPVNDSNGLATALMRLLADESSRNRMGYDARNWVSENFGQARIWHAQLAFLENLISTDGEDFGQRTDVCTNRE